MTRAWRALALAWLGAMVAVALGADCAASSRPLLVQQDGSYTWFPNLGGDESFPEIGPADWALWPPIRSGAVDVRTAGRLTPLEAPSESHWLGTDDRGRDVAARLIHGTRTSLRTAALSAGVALVLALVAGVIAVWIGGAALVGVGAVADVVATAPAMIGVAVVQGLTGLRGLTAVALLIAVPRGADGARMVIAQLRVTLAEPYIDAARLTGASPMRILLRHALPHAAPMLAAATAITAATAILAEAGLTFVGLGMPSPIPSWGDLLAQAVLHPQHWWLSVPVGIAITVTTAALLRVSQFRNGRV